MLAFKCSRFLNFRGPFSKQVVQVSDALRTKITGRKVKLTCDVNKVTVRCTLLVNLNACENKGIHRNSLARFKFVLILWQESFYWLT